jgi:oligopeptide transport system substrate-binding protein
VNRLPNFVRLGVATATILGGTLVGGCGADPYPGLPPAGTLHLALVSPMDGFDPARAGEEIRTICVLNTYDALYQYDYLKRPYELRPCLAASMPEVSTDGLAYVIHLKQGVRFTDDPCFAATGGRGRELTADDVVFSILRLMDAHTASTGTWLFDGKIKGLDAFVKASGDLPKAPHRAAYTTDDGYPEVEGLKAVDRYTVRIGLVDPYPQLSLVLAMPYASIVPREAIAYYGEEFLNHAVGTGPYRLAEYKPAQRAILERNPTYRDERYPSEGNPGDRERGLLDDAGRRLPLNERVVLTVISEDQPRWLYFESGFLDRASIPKDSFDSAIDERTQELRPGLKDRGITLWKEAQFEVLYDTFNMNDAVVGRGERGRAVRRALSLATNYAWAGEHLYNNRVEDMQGPIPRECPEYDPAFVNPWKPASGESREHVLARARRILADAGYPNGDGLPEITVDVPDSTTDDDHFRAWQDDAREVGIRLKPYKTDWQGMMTRVEKGEAQVFGMSWFGDYPDAQNFLQLFYGPNKSPGPNGANYQSAEFDKLYESTTSMQPGAERTALYRRLQTMVVDDCVWVVRYRRIIFYLQHPWLHGYRPFDLSQKLFAYSRIDEAARTSAVEKHNGARPLLPLLGLGSFVVLATVSFVIGSRRNRGW